MNTMDMQTREQVNKIHLDEMHRDARNRRLARELRAAERGRVAKSAIILVLKTLAVSLFAAILLSGAARRRAPAKRVSRRKHSCAF